MKPELVNQVRREQSQVELERLAAAISLWLEHRVAHDKAGQQKSQLQAIRSVLTRAGEQLRVPLATLDAGLPAGEFYDSCRDIDQAVVWLRRVWEYYKDRLDQRDDEELAPILQAADQVIWSCYRQVFERAGVEQGPPPLAFIQPEYSPAARESDQPLPSSLKLPAGSDALNDFIKTLPIPELQLPPWCVAAPWWLVFVGHEVGHHVQTDLGLIKFFRDEVQTTVRAHGVESAEDVRRWETWSSEIFADLFSIAIMGPWAVWAMVEVEWGPQPQMVTRKLKYPAPAVRLALMAEAADTLKLGGTAALRGLPLDDWAADDARLKLDMCVARKVAGLIQARLPGALRTLPFLCRLDAAAFLRPDGRIEKWADALRARTTIAQNDLERLEMARELTCGTLCAWADIAALEAGAERVADRKALAEQARTVLAASGPPGTRANLVPSIEIPDKGEELASLLLRHSREQRAGGS